MSSFLRPGTVSAALAAALLACASSPHRPPSQPSSNWKADQSSRAACPASSKEQRSQALSAAQNGRLRQAALLLDQADRACPMDIDTTVAARVEVLFDLGRFDEGAALGHAASVQTPELVSVLRDLERRRAQWNRATAQSLRSASDAERMAGHEQNAMRLLEQSFERARQTPGAQPVVDAPDGVQAVVGVALAGDGQRLTVAELYGYQVFLLGRDEAAAAVQEQHTTGFRRVLALSSNGSTALIAEPAESPETPRLRCLDLDADELSPPLLMTAEYPRFFDETLALSPDGVRIASYVQSDDNERAQVHVWDCRSGRSVAKLGFSVRAPLDVATSVAFSQSGKLVGFAGVYGGLVVWNLEHGTRLMEREHRCMGCDETVRIGAGLGPIFFVLDETAVLAGQGPNSMVFPGLYPFRKRAVEYREIADIKGVLDDGRTALAIQDGNAVALDVLTRAVAKIAGLGRSVYALGRRKIAALSGSTLALYDLDTKQTFVLARQHTAAFGSARLDGDTLEVRGSRTLRLALPPNQSGKPPVLSRSYSRIELFDDHGPAQTWFTCVEAAPGVSSLPAVGLTDTVFMVRCGTDLVFGSRARPGVVARLRQIAQTATLYALYSDGTAEVWGNPEDLRRVASCRVGAQRYPLEWCERELMVAGRLQSLLR